MNDDQMWCARQWQMLNDGGVWAVPRSGLIFQKRKAERRLVLVSQMPHMHDMPLTPEELQEQQENEFLSIREQFAVIGIKVEKV